MRGFDAAGAGAAGWDNVVVFSAPTYGGTCALGGVLSVSPGPILLSSSFCSTSSAHSKGCKVGAPTCLGLWFDAAVCEFPGFVNGYDNVRHSSVFTVPSVQLCPEFVGFGDCRMVNDFAGRFEFNGFRSRRSLRTTIPAWPRQRL